MIDPVAFIDTETFGLDPSQHMIWEVAVIVDDTEHLWQIEWPERIIGWAEPEALEINRFNERSMQRNGEGVELISPKKSAARFAELVEGRHLVGAVVSFDEERLRRLHNNTIGRPLGRYPWHYHLIDVEALALGYLAGIDEENGPGIAIRPPWKSDQLTDALGIEVGEKHTALADARWAKAVYERVMGS